MSYRELEIGEINKIVMDLDLPVAVDFTLWNKLGRFLWETHQWRNDFETRVCGFYLPVFFWCRQQQGQQPSSKTFFLGINGPQGSGKSTLSSILTQCFSLCGQPAVTISIDDFYLTRKELDELAGENSGNPYLQMRGYPGTHDIGLGLDILTKLKAMNQDEEVWVPRFDKSAFKGRGDRKPQTEWAKVAADVRIVIFEGWMLGFRPFVGSDTSDINLRKINSFLPEYEAWYRQLDSFIHLDAKDPSLVIGWRMEAEENMKNQGLSGMTQDEVKNYVSQFLPAYQAYLPGLRRHPLCPGHNLHLDIGPNRLPAIK
ncbi:MAG: hypothetical protein H6624_17130 [Bdellovibrionaceae bacterium]|nr:hypothetical protein [Bdellovibrionales bacterium]MCB9086071.1 hypothetical protein [Pseudobdellovibrionaceae bacterium]